MVTLPLASPADAARQPKPDKIGWVFVEGPLVGFSIGSGDLKPTRNPELFFALVSKRTERNQIAKSRGVIGTVSLTHPAGQFVGLAGPIVGVSKQRPFIPVVRFNELVSVVRYLRLTPSYLLLNRGIDELAYGVSVIRHPRIDAADQLRVVRDETLPELSTYLSNLGLPEDEEGQMLSYIDTAATHLTAAIRAGENNDGVNLEANAKLALAQLQLAFNFAFTKSIP